MAAPFQIYNNSLGDLICLDGVVSQIATGVRLRVGAGDLFYSNDPTSDGRPQGSTHIGGSGRNLVAVSLHGCELPMIDGIFIPGRPSLWHNGIYTLDAIAGTISDGTGVILTFGGAPANLPVGTWTSTPYGDATTHAGRGAWQATTARECAIPAPIPDASLAVATTTIPPGTLVATDVAHYTHATAPDWTLTVHADGSADYSFQATPMATRPAGNPLDPSGRYFSTPAGAAAYNLTDLEPVNGEPFSLFIQRASAPTVAGFAYLKITEWAGVLTAAAGPFFAPELPASAGGIYYVPIAQSNGLGGIEQLHTGTLAWTSTAGGSSPESPALTTAINLLYLGY